MLIEFTVGNFLSFKEPVTISMVAAKIRSENPSVDENNTFIINNNLTLLTSTAIYGANASGKSNLVRAIQFVQRFVLKSSKESLAGDPIDTPPFRLDNKSELDPSHFELVFSHEGVIYRYGFEVERDRVVSEWCFYSPKGKEARLFSRKDDEIITSPRFKGAARLKGFTRTNALFLSVATQFNNEIAKKITEWFELLITIRGTDGPTVTHGTSKLLLEDTQYQKYLKNLVRLADLGINDIIAKKMSFTSDSEVRFPTDMPQEVRDYYLQRLKNDTDFINIQTLHKVNDENGIVKEVRFDLEDESDGTQKFFYLSGPIIDSLLGGRVIVIDEIEARMHTLLTRQLLDLFNSNETNRNHAQLVFTSHDTNLLDKRFLRRDQIWFIEKDNEGASHLYSLAELKVRNDASFEDDYLRGKYGGLPILGKLHEMFYVSQEDDCVQE